MDRQLSFLKNHADTFAIIGVNVAILAIFMAIVIPIMISHSQRIDVLYTMFYDLLKETLK
jgi:predicted branched-subunit amino acid permease